MFGAKFKQAGFLYNIIENISLGMEIWAKIESEISILDFLGF
jgi:hypothetical protein